MGVWSSGGSIAKPWGLEWAHLGTGINQPPPRSFVPLFDGRGGEGRHKSSCSVCVDMCIYNVIFDEPRYYKDINFYNYSYILPWHLCDSPARAAKPVS